MTSRQSLQDGSSTSNAGEGMALSDAERLDILDAALEVAAPGQLMVGLGAGRLEQVIERGRDTLGRGVADLLLVDCPYSGASSAALRTAWHGPVAAALPDARLILAGRHDDRGYEARLRRLVAKLGLGDAVEFRFDLSEEDKRTTLEEARVMVLPSSVEGFGIVVLEANARGVPVIASSGVPEGAVRHEHNGLRYTYGDIQALARAIVRVLDDSQSYAELSANGLEFAKQFAWREVGARFEEVVLKVSPRERKVFDAAGP